MHYLNYLNSNLGKWLNLTSSLVTFLFYGISHFLPLKNVGLKLCSIDLIFLVNESLLFLLSQVNMIKRFYQK